MPEISRFYGIVISMFYDDHNPPHFHARYGGKVVRMDIETLEVLTGEMSKRGLRLVREWSKLHQRELRRDWELARNGQPLSEIAPLD